MNGKNTLLIEIGTEDLPPTRLDLLGLAFQNEITKQFDNLKIPYTQAESFASARRLAVRLSDVPFEQPNYVIQRKGPQLKAAYQNGQPTKAALGFAHSCGVSIDELKTLETEQGAWLLHEEQVSGKPLTELLSTIITQSIENLNYPKKMRWGDSSLQFIRPIHWITLVHGNTGIDISLLGLQSSNFSFGHRIHSKEKIKIHQADDYLNILKENKVLVDYKERQEKILHLSHQLATDAGGEAVIQETLLDQVTGLVEWPVPLVAKFDPSFLRVPKEALITSMQHHQKCFPLMRNDQLMPLFILVSNIHTNDPLKIIQGNERVMHARLEDAKFFYEKDCQTSLSSKTSRLKKMIYQKKLGTLYEKTERVASLAQWIAKQRKRKDAELDLDIQQVQRAAKLAKGDLVSNLVYEFPELQGTMGYYYALHDKEPENIAVAIKEAYLPAHAKDSLPTTPIGLCLALAERLDTLTGIFGIELIPSGDKDPYALRRAAMGILRILIEKKIDLSLQDLFANSFVLYADDVINKSMMKEVLKFCTERFKYWYQEQGISPQVIDAVLSIQGMNPYDMSLRVLAVQHFKSLEDAQALAAANKRVKNILQKNNISVNLEQLPNIDETLFVESSERILFDSIAQLNQDIAPLLEKRDYQMALSQLATLRTPVDNFFDGVLVMSEDKKLQDNRVALLTRLYALFLRIADISKLAL